MKRLAITCICLLLACGVTPARQGGRGEPIKRPPPPPRKRETRPSRPRQSPDTDRPRPAPQASLRVYAPPGSSVYLWDKERGTVDASGFVSMYNLLPGYHQLSVRKYGHHPYQRTVALTPGDNSVTATLAPYPGVLNLSANVGGAILTVVNVGAYAERITGLELQPRTYQVRGSRRGYRDAESSVEIRPGEPTSFVLTLRPLPPTQLEQMTAASFEGGNYPDAIEMGLLALDGDPQRSRARLLVGLSYYRLARYSESITYVSQAIRSGESLPLSIKHVHKPSKHEQLCAGSLTLRRGVLEFRSNDQSEDNFSVPAVKLSDLRLDPTRGWRLIVKVGVPRKGREKKVEYGFHPPQGFLRPKQPNNARSPLVTDCAPACQPFAQWLYQLIAQLGT